ncbi:ArsB/NhaD family transporter [Campylobacter geochelonis]|uniref:Arsenical pump membrane protein n=1 Tax=Campylobacter geochelonis TaxID=1780362 RepID=A0A128EHR6_9BACT|nr:ArsB/NhaD family transporter [Campylobacter geochelonis]QKF71388.1 arsenical pump membrane protein [Campylobacter geochelonis]CZE48137.1 arsenical pump membrane protein [Campylobacter geochelonis]CZE51477.1 arsenical pump membrane protein [Campylobacter geochelonis]
MAVFIFFLTLFLLFLKPFGLKFGTASLIGALLSLVFGTVNLSDVKEIFHLTYEANIAFIALIVVSMVLEANGFFKFIAVKFFSHTKNTMTLFITTLVLCAFCSAFFANDGAVLVMTPLLLALLLGSNLSAKTITAFMLASSFMVDGASSAFVISNLTNILTANYFSIGFADFATSMFLPNLLCVITSLILLVLYFKKELSGKFILAPYGRSSVIKDSWLLKFQIYTLILMFGCCFLLNFISVCWILLFFGAVLFTIGAIRKNFSPKTIITNAPWQVIIFSVSIYIVVFGLKNSGSMAFLTQIYAFALSKGEVVGILSVGYMSAFLSSIFNNLPAVMITNLNIETLANQSLIYANLLGSNLGTKLSPIGSLATLLWLHILNKAGVKISLWEFLKCGFALTFVVLGVSLLAL